jgi:photosystem II stability/assembly factor-like uncharacterized protein
MPTQKKPTRAPRPKKSTPSSRASKPATGAVAVLIGTRKGAFLLKGDRTRRSWKLVGPHFLGNIVYHLVLDPRDRRTLLMAAKTGHLGPTVFRSVDLGKTWKEAEKPPAFPKAPEGQKGKVVDSVFWLTPGHGSEPGVWYAGTSPVGMFRSPDGGKTWDAVSGFNDHRNLPQWAQEPGTPEGPITHSILVDPRDPYHMFVGISSGGVFESVDKGRDWKPLNKGCEANFLPDPNPEYGHDPHCVQIHPFMPDRIYQQNHCGIYRMDRAEGKWVRIGRNMPKKVGDIGFPMTLHPRDPETCWVFPMDGTQVWPRTSPDGKPAVYMTKNGGTSWKRLDAGLPREQAWFTVKRQGMAADQHDPVGLYFGTTSGEVWASRNGGEKWTCLASHLPHIYSVEAAELGR